MSKCKVAITIRSFDNESIAMAKLLENCDISYKNTTGQRLTEAELIEAIKGANAIIAGTEPITRRVIESAPDLEVISRVGVGIDSIDVNAASERLITIYNTPESPVQAVAEHTIALILAVLKQIPQYSESIHRGDYTLRQGMLLSGKTVGVVGFGRIGFRVATLLDALGCRITYFDPYVVQDVPGRWVRAKMLKELIQSSEIITLHATPLKDGRPLMDHDAIMSCRPGAIIINTARGSLIDETALMNALESGVITGAGLDVLAHEPMSGPLVNNNMVVLTPHVASNTIETRREMEMEAVNNIIGHYEVKDL